MNMSLSFRPAAVASVAQDADLTRISGCPAAAGQRLRISGREEVLQGEGFNSSQIELIREKVPDLDVRVHSVRCGLEIRDVLKEALRFRASGAPVVFKFNGCAVVVGQEESAGSLLRAYFAQYALVRHDGPSPSLAQIVTEERRQEALVVQSKKASEELPPVLKRIFDEESAGASPVHHELLIAQLRDAEKVSAALSTEEALGRWGLLPRCE